MRLAFVLLGVRGYAIDEPLPEMLRIAVEVVVKHVESAAKADDLPSSRTHRGGKDSAGMVNEVLTRMKVGEVQRMLVC